MWTEKTKYHISLLPYNVTSKQETIYKGRMYKKINKYDVRIYHMIEKMARIEINLKGL